MAKINQTNMFAKLSVDSKKKCIEGKRKDSEDTSFLYSGVEDFLDDVEETGDYSMLPLVVHFMGNLMPFDLYSFFDHFSYIENRLFIGRGLDYSVVKKSYDRHRDIIDKSYVDFILEYFTHSYSEVFETGIKYTEEQNEFLEERFTVVKYMLIEIGKRISNVYYTDYIISDDNS